MWISPVHHPGRFFSSTLLVLFQLIQELTLQSAHGNRFLDPFDLLLVSRSLFQPRHLIQVPEPRAGWICLNFRDFGPVGQRAAKHPLFVGNMKRFGWFSFVLGFQGPGFSELTGVLVSYLCFCGVWEGIFTKIPSHPWIPNQKLSTPQKRDPIDLLLTAQLRNPLEPRSPFTLPVWIERSTRDK